jgi:hypothetical protein
MRILILLSFLIADSSHAADLSRRHFLQGTAATATTLKLNPIANVLAQPEVDMLLLQRARFYQMNILNFNWFAIEYILGPRPLPFDSGLQYIMSEERHPLPFLTARPTAYDIWIEDAKGLNWQSPRFREGSAEFALKLAQAEQRTRERLQLSSETLEQEITVTLREMISPVIKSYPRQRAPLESLFEKIYFEELKRELPTFYSKVHWLCKVMRRWNTIIFMQPLKGMRDGQSLRDLSPSERKRIIELNRDLLPAKNTPLLETDEASNNKTIDLIREQMDNLQAKPVATNVEPLNDARQKIVTMLRRRACEEVLEFTSNELPSETPIEEGKL